MLACRCQAPVACPRGSMRACVLLCGLRAVHASTHWRCHQTQLFLCAHVNPTCVSQRLRSVACVRGMCTHTRRYACTRPHTVDHCTTLAGPHGVPPWHTVPHLSAVPVVVTRRCASWAALAPPSAPRRCSCVRDPAPHLPRWAPRRSARLQRCAPPCGETPATPPPRGPASGGAGAGAGAATANPPDNTSHSCTVAQLYSCHGQAKCSRFGW